VQAPRYVPLPETLFDLPTPCAVIDLDRLESNTKRMIRRTHELGVHLRPHVKTHKCVEAARHQVGDHFGGITVSTLAEAERFAYAEFKDITYAVPMAPGRAARAAKLARRLDRLTLLVDDPAALEAMSKEAAALDVTFNVLAKVDCGYNRAGLAPDDPQLVQLVHRIANTASLTFDGVLAHAGHSYDCVDVDSIRLVAEEERRETVRAAEIIRASGLSVSTVSIGSTPTISVVDDLTGVTEVRPGNYALFDVFQSTIGTCDLQDVALSVVTEVIGKYYERGTILVDAGALAMSKDPGAVHVDGDQGFGVICQPASQRPIPGFRLTGLSQEHGKVSTDGVSDLQFEIGDKFRILPNHSCLVTALYTGIYIVRGTKVVDQWHPARGW